MKKNLRLAAILLMAVFPALLISQTVTVEYMKVTQESESLYLQVEQEWKKIHKNRIDQGLINGWSLYRNVDAGYNDPYQYMVITWYDDMDGAVRAELGDIGESLMAEIDTDIADQTMASRVLAHREFSHNLASASNNHGAAFLVVNRMRPTPGNWDAYVESEREVFKPMFEESISQGNRASWGLWNTWPYEEGQIRLVTVDGFDDLAQSYGENMEEIFAKVHPGKDMDEVARKVMSLRDQAQVEVWQLVDSAWPEQE